MVSDRLCAVAASVLLLALALPAPALAQPSAADRETARTLMKKGDEKFAAKDFAGALKDYQAAHAVMQVPTTGLAVAKAQVERGLLIEARETLLSVARLPQDPYESAPLAKAREEAAKLAQRLADRIPSVTITVEGPASGAEVQVDGEAIPAAAIGAPRKVDPGPHVISATAPGFATATANVVLKEGANERVALKLAPGKSTAPPPPSLKPIEGGGVIHVKSPSEPGNVILDGRAVGATPLDVPVSAGSHKVEVEYPGGSRDTQTVDVQKGGSADLTFKPSAMDAIARYRKGVHVGIAGGPAMAAYLDGGPPLFGGTVSFILNLGIIPAIDLRTGVTAGFAYDTEEPKWDLTAVVPVLLKVNYTSWFSFAAGLTVGFVEHGGIDYNNGMPFKGYHSGYVVGPEWSPFILSGGDHRQFELSINQGMRFGNVIKDFHQSVTFTYLFLD